MKFILIASLLVICFGYLKETGATKLKECSALSKANPNRCELDCNPDQLQILASTGTGSKQEKALPNELRVKVRFLEVTGGTSSCFSGKQCKQLVTKANQHEGGTRSLIKELTLYIENMLGGKSVFDESAGVIWRTRGEEQTDRDFGNLPGFGWREEENYFVYQYFVLPNASRLRKERNAESYKLKVYLRRKCDHPRNNNQCDEVCNLTPCQGPEIEMNLSDRNAELVSSSGLTAALIKEGEDKKIHIMFRLIPQNTKFQILKGAAIDETKPMYVVVFIYEDSSSRKTFKPVLFHKQFEVNFEQDKIRERITVEQKFHDGFTRAFFDGTMPLFVKATKGTASTCNGFDNSFLGDQYPNWKNKMKENLAAAVAGCFQLKEGGRKCSKWTVRKLTISQEILDEWKKL